MSEVMNDKGVSMGTFINWTFTLFLSLFTPSIIMWSPENSFYIFAATCGLGALFSIVFVKETKGLSEAQVFILYRSDFSVLKQREDMSQTNTDSWVNPSCSGRDESRLSKFNDDD